MGKTRKLNDASIPVVTEVSSSDTILLCSGSGQVKCAGASAFHPKVHGTRDYEADEWLRIAASESAAGFCGFIGIVPAYHNGDRMPMALFVSAQSSTFSYLKSVAIVQNLAPYPSERPASFKALRLVALDGRACIDLCVNKGLGRAFTATLCGESNLRLLAPTVITSYTDGTYAEYTLD